MESPAEWAANAPPIVITDLETIRDLAQMTIRAHELTIARNGGFLKSGVMDDPERLKELEGRLCSPLLSAFDTTMGSTPAEKYGFVDIFDQVSKYAELLAKDHCFGDGNKRTAVRMSVAILYAVGVDLDVNDSPDPEENGLYQWIQQLVSGEKGWKEVASLLRDNAHMGKE